MSPDKIHTVLCSLDPSVVTIVHGGARGVDTIAGKYATDLGFKVDVFPANWNKHGKAAGPIRNREMISTCEAVYAFWDGKSRGTKNAIDTAIQLKKKVTVFSE